MASKPVGRRIVRDEARPDIDETVTWVSGAHPV